MILTFHGGRPVTYRSSGTIMNINEYFSDVNMVAFLGLPNHKPYIKFGAIMSICSQDIKRERNFDVNQGP